MRDRSQLIHKLLNRRESRESYIRSKLNVLIPSQIRGLRLERPMTQKELADSAEMKQSRISAMERPGEVQFNLETLVRLAAAFKVGLKVEFVAFSEMLDWENSFSQDQFKVTKIDNDLPFLNPVIAIQGQPAAQRTTIQLRDMLNPTSVLEATRANALARMGIFPLRTLLEASERNMFNTGVMIGSTGNVDLAIQNLFTGLLGPIAGTPQIKEDILTNVKYQDVPVELNLVAAAVPTMNLYSGGANQDAN